MECKIDSFSLNLAQNMSIALKHLPLSAIMIESKGNVVYSNIAFKKTFSKFIDDEEHFNLFSSGHFSHFFWLKNIKDVFSGERYEILFEELKIDDKTFFYNIFASPMVDGGNIIGAIVIFEDVTKRVDAEFELKQNIKKLKNANKDLEEFAYIASHDLQEPLRMIASYLQLIEKRYNSLLDKDGKEFMHYAIDGSKRMKQLINDILAFSRITTRGCTFYTVDTNEVLAHVRSTFLSTIKETNTLITNKELPIITADKTQIIQLFQNLIANAIKFRKKALDPVIQISAVQSGDMYEFSIEDNGIGIDEKYSDKVFKIFQRLHTRSEYEGTGIGLALCKRIVKRHGGDISFKSKVGEGTIFTFTLPAHKESEKRSRGEIR